MNIEKVLDMSIYTEKGKLQISMFAEIIEKMSQSVSEEEFNLVAEMLNGGHLLEFLDISHELLKQG